MVNFENLDWDIVAFFISKVTKQYFGANWKMRQISCAIYQYHKLLGTTSTYLVDVKPESVFDRIEYSHPRENATMQNNGS
jgi:hypothetical protein